MTVENFLTQMGIGSKQLTERYAEYPAQQAHDHHLYYAYEPTISSHEHVASTKHHYSGGGHKNNSAMSALTLLAFLFFLHILQQCLKEHMMAMSTPQVMVVSAGREGEQSVAKIINKLDKGGVANDAKTATGVQSDVKIKNKVNMEDNAAFMNDDSEEMFLMKIKTAEHTPYRIPEYKNKLTNYGNRTSIFTSV